jgi:hypothetical protein
MLTHVGQDLGAGSAKQMVILLGSAHVFLDTNVLYAARKVIQKNFAPVHDNTFKI